MQHPDDRRRRTDTWALDGKEGTIGRARDHARGFLDGCRPSPARRALDDALLAISELVTNAVRHAPGPLTLCLTDADGLLTIEVADTSAALPQPRPADLLTGTGGFGWHLVTALSSSLSVEPGPDGKTVRAVVPMTRPA